MLNLTIELCFTVTNVQKIKIGRSQYLKVLVNVKYVNQLAHIANVRSKMKAHGFKHARDYLNYLAFK